jgi:hypothetical protein
VPTITNDPNLSLLEKPITVASASTISSIAILLSATSLNFSARLVLSNAKRCIDKVVDTQPSALGFIQEWRDAINASIRALSDSSVIDPALTSGFLPSDRPTVRLFTRLTQNAPAELLEAIGNLLVASHLTDVPFPLARSKRLNTLNSAIKNEPALTEVQTIELDALLQRSRQDLTEVLLQRLSTSEKSVLRFNSLFLTHLRSDLNSAHEELQKCANLRRFLEHDTLLKTVNRLLTQMSGGNPEALVTLIAFCLNLHWSLVLEIPVARDKECEGALMWIDPTTGVVVVRAQPLLRDLGKAADGCQQVSDTYRLLLPDVVVHQWKAANALMPGARKIGDLLPPHRKILTSLDDHWSESHRSKFIRSSVPNAIREQPNRVVAGYGFLAFHLLTKQDLHYLTISEEQIASIRSNFFRSVGLGETTSMENHLQRRVGSMRTPNLESVQAIFSELDQAVSEIRIGRRYTLWNLIEHHNRYARRVGMFLQFVAGGRNSQHIAFSAASWFAGSTLGYLDDKNAGAAGGKTPVPISPKTTRQLMLWAMHLESLLARLFKLLGIRARESAARIGSILQRQSVPLLFLLDHDGTPREMQAQDLFAGNAETLTRDFGRHFIASTMTAVEQPLADVHGFLRHQGAGINPQSAFGIEVQQDRLLRTALAIDSILSALDIQPLVGLAGASK